MTTDILKAIFVVGSVLASLIVGIAFVALGYLVTK